MQELIEEFIRERTYFKNVSPKTVIWYRSSFQAFEGAMEARPPSARGLEASANGAWFTSPAEAGTEGGGYSHAGTGPKDC
jgi:hypothetical protein